MSSTFQAAGFRTSNDAARPMHWKLIRCHPVVGSEESTHGDDAEELAKTQERTDMKRRMGFYLLW